MTASVSDFRSNKNDQIKHAAEVIGRSVARRKVFEAVYHGKRRVKSVPQIVASTGLTHKQVLTAGKELAQNGIIGQTRDGRDTAYSKDDSYSAHKAKVISLAGDSSKLAKLPTKTNPSSRVVATVSIKLPKSIVDARHITVDDIASLSRVRAIGAAGLSNVPMPEKDFKAGFVSIIGEQGTFQDWGGEQNDLWTTQFKVKSTRLRTAVAFKGPGKKGVLTPARMGKNGDQLQRLFGSDAQVFLLQYWGQVAESVSIAMNAYAIARSIQRGGEPTYYGIIDGIDSARLIKAYPKAFPKEK